MRTTLTIRVDKNKRTSVCTSKVITPDDEHELDCKCVVKERPVRADHVGYGEVTDE